MDVAVLYSFDTLIKSTEPDNDHIFKKYKSSNTLSISNIVQTEEGIIGYSIITGKIYAWGTVSSELLIGNNFCKGNNIKLNQLVDNRFNSRIFLFGTRFNIIGNRKDDKGNDVLVYDATFTPNVVIDLAFNANKQYPQKIIILKVNQQDNQIDFSTIDYSGKIDTNNLIEIFYRGLNPISDTFQYILIVNEELNTLSIISNTEKIIQSTLKNKSPFTDYRTEYLKNKYPNKTIDMYAITSNINSPNTFGLIALKSDDDISNRLNYIGYAYIIKSSTPTVTGKFTNTEHFTEVNNNIIYVLIILIIIILIALLKIKKYI